MFLETPKFIFPLEMTMRKNLVGGCYCMLQMVKLGGLMYYFFKSFFFLQFACKLVAIALHYAWLSAFAWTTVDCVHLYRMLTEMRDVNHGPMGFYYALGYGSPALLVGLSIGVRAHEYGNSVLYVYFVDKRRLFFCEIIDLLQSSFLFQLLVVSIRISYLVASWTGCCHVGDKLINSVYVGKSGIYNKRSCSKIWKSKNPTLAIGSVVTTYGNSVGSFRACCLGKFSDASSFTVWLCGSSCSVCSRRILYNQQACT